MPEPHLDDLARIALAHISMIEEIETGKYKGKPNEVSERKAWLTRSLPKLQAGDAEHQSVAREILALTGQSEPLTPLQIESLPCPAEVR